MKWESSDLMVGAVVLGAMAIASAGLFWLSPASAGDSYPLYTSFDRIDGVGTQAGVVLQGYAVGRVGRIEPRVDADGTLRFRVRLDVQTTLPGGDSLRLPEGTTAHLVPPPIIGSGFIRLETPPAGGAPLAAGSEIRGIRAAAMLERVETMTGSVNAELQPTIRSARALMDSVAAAVVIANRSVQATASSLPGLIRGLEQQLEATYALTVGLKAQVDTLSPAAIAAVDSTVLLLSDVRGVVGDMRGTLGETTPELLSIVARLDTTMILLTHFVREVTRKPWKGMTGVAPPPGLEPPPPGPAIPADETDTVPPAPGSAEPDATGAPSDGSRPGPGVAPKPEAEALRTEGPDALASPEPPEPMDRGRTP